MHTTAEVEMAIYGRRITETERTPPYDNEENNTLKEIIKYLEKERKFYAKEARRHFETYRVSGKRYSCYYNYGIEAQEKKKQIREYIDYLKHLEGIENERN